MKKLLFISNCFILTFVVVVSQPLFGDEENDKNSSTRAGKIISDLEQVTTLNQVTKEVGQIKVPCEACIEKKINQKLFLKSKEVEIYSPYFLNVSDSYTIRLIRTSDTPKKVDLTFRNGGGTICGKGIGGITKAGGLYAECVIFVTETRKEELALDLSNLPVLNPGEEDIIEISFSKKNLKKFDYQLNVEHYGKNNLTGEVKEFWLDFGHNISFKDRSK